MSRFGLSALLEAAKCTAKEEAELDVASDMIIGESVTSDEIKALFIGDGSVESEMDGESLTEDEEEKLKGLLELIPEDSEDEELNLAQMESTLEAYVIKELNGGEVY